MERDLKGRCRDLIEALSRHASGGNVENSEKLRQDSRSPSRNLNPGPLEYEAGALTT
jgi:hypothetical protein